MYRDPDQGAPFNKGVAYEAICYACGASNGNQEPVHQEEAPAEEIARLSEKTTTNPSRLNRLSWERRRPPTPSTWT